MLLGFIPDASALSDFVHSWNIVKADENAKNKSTARVNLRAGQARKEKKTADAEQLDTYVAGSSPEHRNCYREYLEHAIGRGH